MHHVKTTAICRHTYTLPAHSGLRRYSLNLALDVSLDARSISSGDLNYPRLRLCYVLCYEYNSIVVETYLRIS